MNRIGSLASILGFIISIISLFIFEEEKKLWLSGFIIVLFFVLFVLSCFRYYSSKHYLIAYKVIQDIHYDMLCNQVKYNSYTLKESVFALSSVCSRISDMFTDLRKSQVSVCIKYTNKEDDIYYVENLCRDRKSYEVRKNRYNTKCKDNINLNTDFKEIFEKIKNNNNWKDVYYRASNLPQKHQYINTHLVEKLPDNWYSFYYRYKQWPLPYKSTIVTPILSDDNKTIYGFLCVDSDKIKGFNYDHDIKMVQDIALILSPIIRIISEKHLIKNIQSKSSNK